MPNRENILANLETLLKQQEELEEKIRDAQKAERDEALKTVRQLCKRHGFTENMLKGYLAAGRIRKPRPMKFGLD
jgi:hypothetical protein